MRLAMNLDWAGARLFHSAVAGYQKTNRFVTGNIPNKDGNHPSKRETSHLPHQNRRRKAIKTEIEGTNRPSISLLPFICPFFSYKIVVTHA